MPGSRLCCAEPCHARPMKSKRQPARRKQAAIQKGFQVACGSEFQIAEVDPEPGADPRSDRHDHDIIGDESRKAEAANEIGRAVRALRIGEKPPASPAGYRRASWSGRRRRRRRSQAKDPANRPSYRRRCAYTSFLRRSGRRQRRRRKLPGRGYRHWAGPSGGSLPRRPGRGRAIRAEETLAVVDQLPGGEFLRRVAPGHAPEWRRRQRRCEPTRAEKTSLRDMQAHGLSLLRALSPRNACGPRRKPWRREGGPRRGATASKTGTPLSPRQWGRVVDEILTRVRQNFRRPGSRRSHRVQNSSGVRGLRFYGRVELPWRRSRRYTVTVDRSEGRFAAADRTRSFYNHGLRYVSSLPRSPRSRRTALFACLPRRDQSGRCHRQRARSAGGRERCRNAGFRHRTHQKERAYRVGALAILQACFRAAGSAGASIDTGDAEQVARGLLADDRTALQWIAPRVLMPKNKVKLVLNLCLIAARGDPARRRDHRDDRGRGRGDGGERPGEGNQCTPRPCRSQAFLLDSQKTAMSMPTASRPFIHGLVARAAGMDVNVEARDDMVRIAASPRSPMAREDAA